MAKKVQATVKLQLPAGKATPAPPVGSILGANGVNMMDFINAFNDQTKELGDQVLNVRVRIYDDRTFTFTFTGETMASRIRKAAGVDKGSGTPNKTKVGRLTREQVGQLAEAKLADMNAHDLAAAEKMVAGQARSMGIEVTD